MKTVLFVGAGRHQRRAIEQARARGLRVAAVDRNVDAPGLTSADVAEVVDFSDVGAVVEVARRIGVDGVLTISADRTEVTEVYVRDGKSYKVVYDVTAIEPF